ncbi:uncharacterized protein LOC134208287 [Armigeres subalbatus]|uniref:uncharacterized protein LOC134208287 n=1 Tax=Armigeres subalbatus TaxID=124917 RepID=UPI002ED66254
MESRILNSAAARVAPTSAHFIGGKRSHTFAGGFHQFTSEKSIRSLQYSIPAVGNHYGNAFAPDDEIDDDGGEDDDCRGLRTVTLGPYSQSMNVGSMTDGEYYDEDDEEIDEDVEMSPAIEVISIDPNCDYDSDEEEEEEEEEEQIREAVVEVHPPVTYQ